MKTKNLLFVIPEMTMGGAQRSLFNISHHLAKEYNVSIVVFNKTHKAHINYADSVLSLNVKTGSNPFRKTLAFIQRIGRLKKLKKKLNIHVSISFLEGADYVNILSRNKEKIILSIRGSKLHDENMQRSNFMFRQFLIRKLYKYADEIVCVNNGIANEIKHYYRIENVPVHVIYNFYEVEKIDLLANEPLSMKDQNMFNDLVITMSGRLAIEKGNTFVVKVFSLLKKTYPTLRLVFIGDGPQRNSIMELGKLLNMRVAYEEILDDVPDIFITAEQENVFKYLKGATLYILNSSSEGFPNGLVEAMICGVPVVAADCPYGPKEILQPENAHEIRDIEFAKYGVLIPFTKYSIMEDAIISKWVEAISTLLNSKELREKYGKLSRERAKLFSMDKSISKWKEIIGL